MTATPLFDGHATRMAALAGSTITGANNATQSPQVWGGEPPSPDLAVGLYFRNDDIRLQADPKYGKVYLCEIGPGSSNPWFLQPTKPNGELAYSRPIAMGQWDWYVDAFKILTPYTILDWNVICQYGYPALASPPLSISFDRTGLGIDRHVGTLRAVGDLTGALIEKPRFWLLDEVYDKWVEMIIGVKWAVDATGEVQVYGRLEGESQFSEKWHKVNTPTFQRIQGQPIKSEANDKMGLYFGTSASPPTNRVLHRGFQRFASKQGGMMALDPHITEETQSTVTLSWTPDLSGQGYRLYVDGVAVSRTFKPDASSTRFSKPDDQQHAYGVQKMDVVDALEQVDFPPDPPDPPPTTWDIDLLNQKWSPTGAWGDAGNVRVQILEVSPRRDAVALAGSGTVDRFYGDQHSGDMFKIGPATTGPVVIGRYDQQSEFYSREFYGDVHQDGIQAMGGKDVTFRGFYAQKDAPGNSHLFCNMGSGGQMRPTDIVVEFAVLNGYRGHPGHEGGTTVRISDSIRCGIRHVLIINKEGPPAGLVITNMATDPVVVDSYEMTHTDWDSIGGNANGPRHRDLWNADGSHKPLLDQLIAQGKARLLSA